MGKLSRLAQVALDRAASGDARASAVASLADVDTKELARIAPSLVGDADPLVRAACAFKAWQLDPATAASIIRSGLEDPVSEVRRGAAIAVTQAKPPGVVPILVTALQKLAERSGREKDPERARMLEEADLLLALQSYGRDLALRAARPIAARLLELASDSDLDDSEAGYLPAASSAEILATSGVPEDLVSDLADLLGRSNISDRVRKRALIALGNTGGPAAIEAIRDELARSIDGESKLPREEIEKALAAARASGA